MKKNNLTYMESVHRYGRIWGIVVGAVLLCVPILLSILFDTLPNGEILLKGFSEAEARVYDDVVYSTLAQSPHFMGQLFEDFGKKLVVVRSVARNASRMGEDVGDI